MNKELIDKAWACLPREFKEEVKKMRWSNHYTEEQVVMIRLLFGDHNLTSDAEREDEILTANKKDAQEQYALQIAALRKGNLSDIEVEYRVKLKDMLEYLFGSKCLPDVPSSVPSTKSDVPSTESNPAEPKFIVGDTASYVCSPTLKHKCTVTKVMQNEHSGKWEYNVMFEWGKPGMWIPESDLEPYNEPKEENHIAQDLEMVDTIIKDSFS